MTSPKACNNGGPEPPHKGRFDGSETVMQSSEAAEAEKQTRPATEKRHPGFGETPEGMSRNQFKKLKKAEMREKTRDEWRARVRAKQKEKKKLKKLAIREGVCLLNELTESDIGLIAPVMKKEIVQEPSNLRVVLDVNFESLMLSKELGSVGRQVQRCYSSNRRAKHPVGIHVTSHSGKIKEWFNTKAPESVHWRGVNFHEKPYGEIFAKEDLIYLSADSDNIISALDETKVYIIGGIVDKNRHKLLTLNKAKEQGIATAQLPISDFVKQVTRKVLAINHVFEILVKFLEYRDWEKAFMEVIPQRKFNQDTPAPAPDVSEESNGTEDE
ncbi:tRNA methyltransferase 10 [Massospora cicadina]|nr:tRNA methyltransferase 10 [Massospora cicadina]